MISSLPKFDKDVLDACQPVTLNGMRLLFPGRAVKLCLCREITDDDLKDLTDFVAADLGVAPDGAKLSYIALCNPVVTMGAGADKYYLTGYEDPVFGAKDHPIKFYGSEILLYGKKYLCLAAGMQGDYTLSDIMANDEGTIFITPFVRIDIAGRTSLFRLSDGNLYINEDPEEERLKEETRRREEEEERRRAAEERRRAAEERRRAAEERTRAAEERRRAAEERTRETEERRRAAEERRREEIRRRAEETLRARTVRREESGSSTPAAATARAARGYRDLAVKKLFPYAQSLRAATVISLLLCIFSLAAELFVTATWFEDLSAVDFGTLTFSFLIIGEILLECATAAVYVLSFLSVKRIFPQFRKMSYRHRRSLDMNKTLSVRKGLLLKVNCYYIFIALHAVTRLAFFVFSSAICEELYSVLRFGL